MPGPQEITPKKLFRLIGTPKAPAVVDLRIDEDFDDDPRMIPGAFRHGFRDVEGLLPRLRGRHVVVYCQKGRKISQGAAALLRAEGVVAEALEGGQFAWRDLGLPMVDGTVERPQLWVTRHRPKIDRIACPWLIRRFIDADARFLFVPPGDVGAVAERFGATPFDVEGVTYTHRGELCSFDTLMEDFGLEMPALSEMARVIRGADTNRHDLAPQAAGLLALSVGLSRWFSDDSEQLEQGMVLYDALFHWARDGMAEGHDWPAVQA